MNDSGTVHVRPGPIRSGSTGGRVPRTVDDPEPGPPDGPSTNQLVGNADQDQRLFDWVPAAASGADYPIEGGVPHPHWVRESAEHRLAAHPVAIDESAVVVRLLVALAIAAFVLGLMVFYPVSPLGN